MCEGRVSVIHEETPQDQPNWVRPCPPKFELGNWRIFKQPRISVANSISNNKSSKSSDTEDPDVDFMQLINQAEDGEDEDWGLPPELKKMIKQEDREVKSHQEETKVLNLGVGEERKEIKVGTGVSTNVRDELVALLWDYQDIFTWSYQDMPNLSPDIVQHRLPLNPEWSSIKQKLRRMKPGMSLKIKEEVKKQFDAGFLAIAWYLKWIANILPVPKKDGKVRMCTDYRDLNRASPKDNFSLPYIDILIDNMANFALFSFMDGFSGYNQIKMAPEDMEKTTFVTLWGTFYYKVMSFGLKNAGATYQRAMVALFHDMMHKEIEVYMNDMIAKSKTEEEHLVTYESCSRGCVSTD